ncbi:MAG: c-type cytochrome domain-containing protein, partial [Gemmataceae bacterium]
MPSNSMRFRPMLALVGLLLPTFPAARTVCAASEQHLPPAVQRSIDFVKDVQPIFAASCYSCHGAKKRKGDLRLDRKGSALGSGVIVPGKSRES